MCLEQKRVAVGSGNGHFISIRQVSSGAARVGTRLSGTGDHAFTPPPLQLLLLLPMLLYIDNVMIKN